MSNKKKFTFPSLYEIRKRRLKKAIKMHELNKQYYEIDQEIQAYKKLSKQGSFSKKTIIFCLGFISIFALLCLYVEYKAAQDNIKLETYLLLRVIAAVFGGELLFLLLKRIWSSDDNKISKFVDRFSKKKKGNNEIAEESKISMIQKPEDITQTNTDAKSAINDMVNEVNNSIKGGLG